MQFPCAVKISDRDPTTLWVWPFLASNRSRVLCTSTHANEHSQLHA